MRPYRSARSAMLSSLGLLVVGLGSGCTGGSSPDGISFEDSQHAAGIVHDFAYEVVVPTYELLSQRLDSLENASRALQADPDETTLGAARAAWIDARSPWEQSEGFLFGPVDARGIDPGLDSWPVNKTDLEAVLTGEDDLTAGYVSSLDPTLKGFHTAEYLLFGDANDKMLSAFTSRELDYLVAVTAEMALLGEELALSWSTGLDGSAPYAELVAGAGESGNLVYPSRTAAAEELVRGAIGILDEVANGKIADPFDQQDQTLVESQFSYNSLTDFADNVRSVQNAYLGRNLETGEPGIGLTLFIAEVDAELDARVQAEIQAGIDAIGLIPSPFRDAILDPDAADEILAAQEALRTAQSTFEQEILPLITN